MKGASVDCTNTINFGTIINYNECGNYEIATIQSVAGNTITLFQEPSRTYNTNYKVQLVSKPTFTNATVTAPITCTPWNGNKGGILALFVTNTLTLKADCSGKGFRGCTISSNPNGGCVSSNSGYAFDLSQIMHLLSANRIND